MTAKPYVNPYLGGTLLGIVLFSAFLLTGGGLGASGAINRVQVSVVDLVAPDHVDRVPYFADLAGGDKNPLADPSVLMLVGVLLGGFASGLAFGRVKPEIRRGPNVSNATRLITAFIGGGQALSGGAVLSVGSWAFMLSVFAGGYMLAWFVRRLWN
ncbi:MAG: hypothetical protein BWX66_01920 [Deltaproteobacteria bacterium ADurb.Bin058]|nr:MAG: hypothetical protein BWX66_01920 [Deltaproteobacteria bacterium ADurb.Bin058]